jgi:hypothetical protein
VHLAYLVAEMAYLRCSFQPSSSAKYKIFVLSKGKRFEREIEAGLKTCSFQGFKIFLNLKKTTSQCQAFHYPVDLEPAFQFDWQLL